ncbi:MAG: Dam family site-specific DNA-(adenine-N6)-methyltransferase [Candidatus Hydrogenedentota bacterium]
MTRKTNNLETPRPFLKWVGGKGQLLNELLARVDAAGDFGRYHEPFMGGAALFYAMQRTKRLKKKAYLADYNPRLVATYEGVQQNVEALIRLLKMHKKKHAEPYYYQVREALRDDVASGGPRNLVQHAARIIYLNKTGFNGLYRENNQGLYNVPIGSYTNPAICDEDNLRACAKALKKANVQATHFATIIERVEKGDLVYFDPPYDPVSKTASFTSYAKGGFGEDSQRLLAQTCKDLHAKGVKVLLSNSYTEFIRDLYNIDGFKIEAVSANRNINSNAKKRGAIQEALVRNF